MNSNKNIIIGAIVVVAIAGLVWILFREDSSDDVDNPTVVTSVSPSPRISVTISPTPTPKPVLRTVRMTSAGLSPKTLTIRSGDAVSFMNDTGTAFWPASDPHPTHTLCPGFDAGRVLGSGESYTLTFSTARTCTYHNHLDPYNASSRGTIIIQ